MQNQLAIVNTYIQFLDESSMFGECFEYVLNLIGSIRLFAISLICLLIIYIWDIFMYEQHDTFSIFSFLLLPALRIFSLYILKYCKYWH